MRVEVGGRHCAAAHDRAEVAADQRDQVGGAHRANTVAGGAKAAVETRAGTDAGTESRTAHDAAGTSGARVPLSQMPSISPSASAPVRTAGASRDVDHGEHAPGRLAETGMLAGGECPPASVATLDRRGKALTRLQVHTAGPQRGVGVGHPVQAAAGTAQAADEADEMPDLPIGRGPGGLAVQQVGEQLIGAGMRAPQVARVEVREQRDRAPERRDEVEQAVERGGAQGAGEGDRLQPPAAELPRARTSPAAVVPEIEESSTKGSCSR